MKFELRTLDVNIHKPAAKIQPSVSIIITMDDVAHYNGVVTMDAESGWLGRFNKFPV